MAARISRDDFKSAGWGAMALLVAAVVITFGSAARGEFLVWDDDVNITGNPHLRDLTWEHVKWMFTDTTYMRRYVPFAWLGWAIEHQVFGLTAVSAHVGNILFHAINAVLVFLLVGRIAARRGGEDARFGVAVALVAALIWALHPLRVEVVAWASGRMYAQGACFALLGLLAYLRAAEIAPGGPGRWRWLTFALAAMAAAILTYPVFVPVVAVLPLIDIYVLRRLEPGMSLWRGACNRAVWLEKLPFLALAGGIGLVTILARGQAQGIWAPPPTLANFPLVDRIAQAGYVWSYYVWKPLVPAGLAPVYTTLIDFDARGAVFISSVAGVVAASAVLFWQRGRWPGVWALWLAHLLLIAPMLGLAEKPHYTSDRYSYLQGVLWAIAVGWFVLSMGRRAAIGAALAGLVLASMSISQISLWRGSEEMFRRLYSQIGAGPYRADIAMRLGDVLRRQGRFVDAAEFYEESLRILPHVPRAAVSQTGLARIAAAEGRAQAALDRYKEALRLDAKFVDAWAGLGELLFTGGKPAEAVVVLEKAASLQGGDAAIRELLGMALVQARRPAEAVGQFEASLRLRPNSPITICNLVVALADSGRGDEAVALGREVARRAAGVAQAHFALGHALRVAGKKDEALSAFSHAIQLQPDHAAAREALAALRAP